MKVHTTLVTQFKKAAADLVLALVGNNLVVSPHQNQGVDRFYRFDVMAQGDNIDARISEAIMDAELDGLVWEAVRNPVKCPHCLAYPTESNNADHLGIQIMAVCPYGHTYMYDVD